MPRLSAALFPGQGSQRDDMAAAPRTLLPELVAQACELTGDDVFARAAEATSFQQPALFLAGLASWPRLCERERPAVLAGHSLGELTAVVAAGMLDAEAGLRLVVARGRLMQQAAELTPSGMAAVRGDRDTVAPLIERSGAVVANDNSPRQVVVAGADAELDDALKRLAAGGIRAKRLAVAGAFHTRHMGPAVAEFRAELDRVEFHAAEVPVVSCVTAELLAPEEAPDVLARALTSPVRWVDTLRALAARGVTRTVEASPGIVLSGLVRRTLEGVDTATIDEAERVGA